MLQRRNDLSPALKVELDQRICRFLLMELEKKDNNVVHTYIPMSIEIDILPIIRHLLDSGVEIVTPKTLQAPKLQHLILRDLLDLDRGIYNTQFPHNGIPFEGEYDIIIVPGLAFDRSGNRLGYGKGYYDYFLSRHPNVLKIAVGYAFQLVDFVPTDASDVPVDLVITENRVYPAITSSGPLIIPE